MLASPYSLAVAGYSLLFICLQSLHVMAISPLSVVGSKFFTSDGDQFYIKGVAYQLVPEDPLIDTEQCTLDASLMKELGANTIRVYHVDADGDHKGCMSAFADAGIYLFVDLDTFDTQIEQTSPHWNDQQFEAFKKVLDEFQQYDNTAGVFVGNEVLTTDAGSPAAPYVLAAARDIKAYRDSKGYRKIPVGYSAADIAQLRPMLQNYMACSTNASERLDFFSLNAYEWCGDSSYTTSGYSELEKNATGYPIPIFFSETGCNTPAPRTFQDQAAIFGPEMSGTWSGAIIYEWIEEANNYGLVNYGPYNPNAGTNSIVQDGYTRQGTPTPISPDFTNLKSQWATLSPTGVALSEYSASANKVTFPPCPASTSGGWQVNPSSPLPTLGQTLGKEASQATSTASASGTGASATKTGASSTSSAKSGAAIRATVAGPNHGDGLGSIAALCGLVGVVAFLL
ncbi:CAZyme family GH72 [Paecilomyces variotii]|nr:CAZyme family GH72 [Paecilomyces variotii]